MTAKYLTASASNLTKENKRNILKKYSTAVLFEKSGLFNEKKYFWSFNFQSLNELNDRLNKPIKYFIQKQNKKQVVKIMNKKLRPYSFIHINTWWVFSICRVQQILFKEFGKHFQNIGKSVFKYKAMTFSRSIFNLNIKIKYNRKRFVEK